MVTRSLVLVLLHVGCALGLYGVSGLVNVAAAATNAWSSSNSSVQAYCGNQSSAGAAAGCFLAWADTQVDCTWSDAGSGPVTGSDPNYGYVTRASRPGGEPGFCGLSDTITANWSFTAACDSPATFDAVLGACVEPFDCGDFGGMEADRFYSDSEVGGAICASPPGGEGEGCLAELVGFGACAGGECFARVAFTGGGCGAEPDETGDALTDQPGNMNCVSGGGVTVCAPQNSQNCGTVNGESVCLDAIPDGRCTFLGNGGMVCASDAAAPPAPTDSSGMSPATPDGEFNAGSEDSEAQDFDYFGPGTVAESGTPTSGTGSTGTSDEGDEEGGECSEPGSCEGVLPVLGETETVAEATQAFLGAVEGSPLIAAAMSIGTSIPEGECPAPSITIEYLGDMTLTLDAHCGIWDEVAGVLSALMLAVFVFLGVRIVLSA